MRSSGPPSVESSYPGSPFSKGCNTSSWMTDLTDTISDLYSSAREVREGRVGHCISHMDIFILMLGPLIRQRYGLLS